VRCREARQQAGFADPRLALHQDEPGVPSLYRLHFGIKDRQLSRTADEMVHYRSVGTCVSRAQLPRWLAGRV
jgi:hypothetical protein